MLITQINKKIPNYLTILRIILIPILIISFYSEQNYLLVTSLIFIIAGLSDFLDGYLSRRFDAQSNFGKMMDPIADKLIVVTSLILILDVNIYIKIMAILIILREVFVSGLREFLALQKIEMPVTQITKLKTANQFIAITLLLYSYNHPSSVIFLTGAGFLCVATILTVSSGIKYYYDAAKDEQL